jgi:hypothetical protein
VIAGIVQLVQGQIGLGIVLIVVGLLVGPGGVSVFATGATLGLVGVPLGRRHRTSPAEISPVRGPGARS